MALKVLHKLVSTYPCSLSSNELGSFSLPRLPFVFLPDDRYPDLGVSSNPASPAYSPPSPLYLYHTHEAYFETICYPVLLDIFEHVMF